MTVHMLRQPGAGECVRTYGRQGPFQASDPRPMLADMHLVARSTEVLYDLGVRVWSVAIKQDKVKHRSHTSTLQK
jgi:hypothetical protein